MFQWMGEIIKKVLINVLTLLIIGLILYHFVLKNLFF
jgi:hypothetical protein